MVEHDAAWWAKRTEEKRRYEYLRTSNGWPTKDQKVNLPISDCPTSKKVFHTPGPVPLLSHEKGLWSSYYCKG